MYTSVWLRGETNGLECCLLTQRDQLTHSALYVETKRNMKKLLLCCRRRDRNSNNGNVAFSFLKTSVTLYIKKLLFQEQIFVPA